MAAKRPSDAELTQKVGFLSHKEREFIFILTRTFYHSIINTRMNFNN